MADLFHRACQRRQRVQIAPRFEPTEADKLMCAAANGLQNLMALAAIALFLAALGGWMPELWRGWQ